MTISSVTSKVIYVGTGSTAAAAKIFAYPFRILAEADLTVSDYNIATSVATVKVLNTDYVVSGVGDSGGGNVTITGSYTNLPTSSKLVIQRIVDLTQGTDYVENDPFPAETHENALDKLTMATQQLQEQLDRAIKADITTTAGTTYLEIVAAATAAASSSATVAVAQASTAAVQVDLATDQAVLASGYAASVSLPILPSSGGTGISNDNTSTVTISGNAPLTINLTSASILNFPTSGTLATTGTTGVFIARVDPTASFTHTTMTTNNTWVSMNYSSVVSTGATAILLNVLFSHASADQQLQFRKNGNTTAAGQLFTQAGSQNMAGNLIIPCDTGRVIEYYGTNGTFASISVTATGYFM